MAVPVLKLTRDQIVPEDYQQVLMSAGESISQSCWQIGDIANELYKEAIKNSAPVTQSDVHLAVAYYCGKSSSSVRKYATIADFFPPTIRSQYEMLSFSHFSFAIQFKDHDQWKEVLETALAGGILSVSQLRSRYTFTPPPPTNFPAQEETIKIPVRKPETTCETSHPKTKNTVYQPGTIQAKAAYTTIVNLRRMLYALPVDKNRVDQLIAGLTELIHEVVPIEIDESSVYLYN